MADPREAAAQLVEAGDLAGALAAYDRAVAAVPTDGTAWRARGRVLHRLGRPDDAAASYRAALNAAPDDPYAWAALLGTGRYAAADEAPERAQAVLDALPPDSTEARVLHFALGKARRDQARRAAAFAHYASANALVRASFSYDVGADEAYLQRIAAAFTPELTNRLLGRGSAAARPIFIVGMPRSGTTLVEQILAGHPAVQAGGECPALPQVVGAIRLKGDDSVAFPEILDRVGPSDLALYAQAYLQRLPAAAAGTTRITDKLPPNFRFVGLLQAMLPSAAIVHVRRDPLDTCWSCFRQDFTRRVGYAFDLAELGRYYRAYAGLMAHWRTVLPAGAMLELDYEQLVAEPELTVARLLAHCGLSWDDACLAFAERGAPVGTASQLQVGSPVYTHAVGRWKPFAPFLGPLLAELGAWAPAEARHG